MATHKSALKKVRKDRVRRERNRSHRSRLRTALKKFRETLDGGDVKAAQTMLPGTVSLIDRSAKLGVIHGNTAARTKARITRALNKLASGS